MRYRIAQWAVGPVVAVAVAAGSAQDAHAAAESGTFSIHGLGAQLCRNLVAAIDEEGGTGAVAAALSHWVGGYLTQANRSTPGVFEVAPVTDVAVLAQMARNLCRANPDSLVESAVAGVLASFAAVAQTTETPLVEAKNGQHAVRVRRDVLRQTQAALAEEGFLPAGSADGTYGPRTRQALTTYQTKRGLTVTGVPDAVTLVTLFLSGRHGS